MNYKIILASGSPRRRELMNLVGADYIVIPSNKEEDMSGHDPEEMVKRLSEMKARDVLSIVQDRVANGTLPGEYSNCVVIGCDTVVAYNGKILGKPHNETEAFDMIRDFSGLSHHVLTGVCLIKAENCKPVDVRNYAVSSSVKVAPMTDDEIRNYIATGESLDKAGAYAIQGRFCPFIEGIEGDYYNIVGFPIHSIYSALKDMGIALF